MQTDSTYQPDVNKRLTNTVGLLDDAVSHIDQARDYFRTIQPSATSFAARGYGAGRPLGHRADPIALYHWMREMAAKGYNVHPTPRPDNGAKPAQNIGKRDIVTSSGEHVLIGDIDGALDEAEASEIVREIEAATGLVATMIIQSSFRHKWHVYFCIDGEMSVEELAILQYVLTVRFPKLDQKCKDVSRVLRCPGVLHVKSGQITQLRYDLSPFTRNTVDTARAGLAPTEEEAEEALALYYKGKSPKKKKSKAAVTVKGHKAVRPRKTNDPTTNHIVARTPGTMSLQTGCTILAQLERWQQANTDPEKALIIPGYSRERGRFSYDIRETDGYKNTVRALKAVHGPQDEVREYLMRVDDLMRAFDAPLATQREIEPFYDYHDNMRVMSEVLTPIAFVEEADDVDPITCYSAIALHHGISHALAGTASKHAEMDAEARIYDMQGVDLTAVAKAAQDRYIKSRVRVLKAGNKKAALLFGLIDMILANGGRKVAITSEVRDTLCDELGLSRQSCWNYISEFKAKEYLAVIPGPSGPNREAYVQFHQMDRQSSATVKPQVIDFKENARVSSSFYSLPLSPSLLVVAESGEMVQTQTSSVGPRQSPPDTVAPGYTGSFATCGTATHPSPEPSIPASPSTAMAEYWFGTPEDLGHAINDLKQIMGLHIDGLTLTALPVSTATLPYNVWSMLMAAQEEIADDLFDKAPVGDSTDWNEVAAYQLMRGPMGRHLDAIGADIDFILTRDAWRYDEQEMSDKSALLVLRGYVNQTFERLCVREWGPDYTDVIEDEMLCVRPEYRVRLLELYRDAIAYKSKDMGLMTAGAQNAINGNTSHNGYGAHSSAHYRTPSHGVVEAEVPF